MAKILSKHKRELYINYPKKKKDLHPKTFVFIHYHHSSILECLCYYFVEGQPNVTASQTNDHHLNPRISFKD